MPKGGKRPGAGRPTGSVSGHTLLAQEMRKALIEAAAKEWGPIIKNLVIRAKHDDYAVRELFDRIFGKATQPLAGIDDEGNMKPIPILANLNVSTDERNKENRAT